LAGWYWRSRLTPISDRLRFIVRAASTDFGFETLNRQVVRITQRVAIELRRTQTGKLNWNIAGIVGGLIMVLLVVLIGK